MLDVIMIVYQNLQGPESNIDCINEGGNVILFALHQVRDQILPDLGLIPDRNLARENIYNNVCGEVNNQNLHGYNPTRNNMNKLVEGLVVINL